MLFMSNTDPYTKRVKEIALSEGVELSDDEALERLLRIVSLAKEFYQPNETYMHDRRER